MVFNADEYYLFDYGIEMFDLPVHAVMRLDFACVKTFNIFDDVEYHFGRFTSVFMC
jgi:hypothetical protein